MKKLITLGLGVLIGRAISKPEETKAALGKLVEQVRARTGGTASQATTYAPTRTAPAAPTAPPPPTGTPSEASFDPVDEFAEESFPASDPPSSWAGQDHPRT